MKDFGCLLRSLACILEVTGGCCGFNADLIFGGMLGVTPVERDYEPGVSLGGFQSSPDQKQGEAMGRGQEPAEEVLRSPLQQNLLTTAR